MIASPQQEAEIMTQILALKNDPVGFAEYTYPWGSGAPGTQFAKGLRVWQREELKRLGEHVQEQAFRFANDLPLKVYRAAWSSGRGPGKSGTMGIITHWHMSTHIGSTTTVSANAEHQLRSKFFPELAVWMGAGLNSHWFTIETLRVVPAPWLLELVKRPKSEGGLAVDPKYWYVQGAMWSADSPNAFAGTHNPYGLLLLFDEAAGIPSEIWNVARGFFTEQGPFRFHIAASQMRHRSGTFFDVFNDDNVGREWHRRTISTRGMEGIDQTEIEAAIKTYGPDSDYVRVEIDGLPPRTSDDQFISWESVRAAMSNDLFRDYGEPLILGVDPAPRGKTGWRFRQGRNARDCCGSATGGSWLNKDNIQIAEAVLELDRKYRPDAICIDFGLGSGVIDYIKRKRTHGRLHEVKFGDAPHGGKDSEWGSHAAELWARTRDWLPGAMIPQDNGEKGTLTHQLTDRGWRYSQREEGKKILETKEDMRKRGVDSPDDADALACTFEVNPPRLDQMKQRRQIIADGVDDGPF